MQFVGQPFWNFCFSCIKLFSISSWVLGGESVIELYEYKNLGVVKNYIGSFSINADDNIDKTQKKLVCYFPQTLTGRGSAL